jgi:hypothetical protein
VLIPNRRATDNRAGAGAPDAAYDKRSADVWATLNDSTPEELYAKIDYLVATLPPDSPLTQFERACAFDSTGHPDRAVPLYQTALEMGIGGERRRRSVIQLSSSLRNLGRVSEAVQLLEAERAMPSDHLDDAVSATLALALVDSGREREAVSVALAALAPHLPRYQRSMANYARLLIADE